MLVVGSAVASGIASRLQDSPGKTHWSDIVLATGVWSSAVGLGEHCVRIAFLPIHIDPNFSSLHVHTYLAIWLPAHPSHPVFASAGRVTSPVR